MHTSIEVLREPHGAAIQHHATKRELHTMTTTTTNAAAVSLTEKETAVLNALIKNLYAEPGFSDVCAKDLANSTGIPVKQVRGVIASLVKKDIVWVAEEDKFCGIPALVYLSEDNYWRHPKWGKEEGQEVPEGETAPEVAEAPEAAKEAAPAPEAKEIPAYTITALDYRGRYGTGATLAEAFENLKKVSGVNESAVYFAQVMQRDGNRNEFETWADLVAYVEKETAPRWYDETLEGLAIGGIHNLCTALYSGYAVRIAATHGLIKYQFCVELKNGAPEFCHIAGTGAPGWGNLQPYADQIAKYCATLAA